ncbi:MAG: nucleotidyltransferase family protein [Pseudomonadota bacterium]
MALAETDFIGIALSNPANAELFARLPSLGLPQTMLTAGCLFQTLWNRRVDQPPDWGIKDYDIFYFDETDLSWEAEDAVISKVEALCSDLGIAVEIRNQARVHLWYEKKFGHPYPTLHSAHDGVDRFLISGTCVALEVETGRLYAPFGLDDIDQGILRMNPNNQAAPHLFHAKAQAYQERWPWLRVDPSLAA